MEFRASAPGPVTGAPFTRTRPDVCLVASGLPGGAIPTTRRLSVDAPAATKIILADTPVAEDVLAALYAGADGYLLKGIDGARLRQTLEAAVDGEVAVSRRVVSDLVREVRRHGRRHVTLPGRRPVELTPRESEILDLMRADLPTAEIARRLFIAEVTVRSHISSILRRLGVPDRESAIRLLDHS